MDAIMLTLPFLKKNKPGRFGGGYSYWSVTPTGNYWTDYQEGERLAHAFLPMLQFVAGPVMLGSIVVDMMAAGYKEEEKGLVLGFMRVIGKHCSLCIGINALIGGKPPPGAA